MKTVRIIVPAYPEVNIFTRQANKTTALGPVVVATAINRLKGVRVEIIDENNYRGEKDNNGLPNHMLLQMEDPATIVGFYCGLSSTMERVWELAKFYKDQGADVIAGGWHAHYCPEEVLSHNVDVVVHGDAELVICQLIENLISKSSLEEIPGISFKPCGETVWRNEPKMLESENLEDSAYPNFGLLRLAKIKIYPIGRTRGCGMNCEFCSVKGEPRYASGDHLFKTVKWLVETRKARDFFIVDDRLEQDLKGTTDFFEEISYKYGNRLSFTVQVRLGLARNSDFLELMKKAGVRCVCIGYESPIDEDLKAMNKGYSSSKMIEWTKILRRYFWIHGMFIVGYPLKEGQRSISSKETVKRYKKFIRKARIDTIQVLLPVPLVGTELRKRLGDRVYPSEIIPWSMYDGNYPCFKPDNMSPTELQQMGMKIMKGFYQKISLVRVGIRTVTFPVDLVVRGWSNWYRGWRRDTINYFGHILISKWLKRHKNEETIKRLG
jgi:radical SAM superfamily enzyme YgiQ (UPF0313 family)